MLTETDSGGGAAVDFLLSLEMERNSQLMRCCHHSRLYCVRGHRKSPSSLLNRIKANAGSHIIFQALGLRTITSGNSNQRAQSTIAIMQAFIDKKVK